MLKYPIFTYPIYQDGLYHLSPCPAFDSESQDLPEIKYTFCFNINLTHCDYMYIQSIHLLMLKLS